MYSPVRDDVRVCQSSKAPIVALAYDELEEVWSFWLMFSFHVKFIEVSVVVESS
jgi:hypothetical protein